MIRHPAGRRAAGALALVVGLAGCTNDDELASTTAGLCSSHVERVADLPAVLVEASGITRDPRSEDLYWAHNDSGNPAEIFGLSAEGLLLAIVPIAGVSETDPEDIATGPCGDGSTCLYLGDIGDNLAVRGSISVHRLPLPDLPSPDSGTERRYPPVRALSSATFVYPNGPRDAEGLAVDADRSELIVVTKGREGVVEVYWAPLDGMSGSAQDTLLRAGSLKLPIGESTRQLITAADLSPDGTLLVVRSYTTLYGFAWSGAAAFDSTIAPRHASLLAAVEAQGEGVAWDARGGTLTLVSEGREGRPPSLSRIRCSRPAGM